MMYEPVASVGCSDGKLVYHQHKDRDYELTAREAIAVAAQWIPIFFVRWLWAYLAFPWRFLKKRLRSRDA